MHSEARERASSRHQVVEHYDALAPRYARLYEGRTRLAHFYHMRQRRVLELLQDVAGGRRLLEVGCGPAYLASASLMGKMRYVGVDISTGMIRLCRQQHSALESARFLVGDTQDLPLPSSSFDIVLCLGMLEYVPRAEVAIRELGRVLRPGGICIVSGINKWSPYNAWDRLVYRKITGRRPAAIRHEYHCEEEYAGYLASHGMRVMDIVYFDFDLFLAPLDRRLARIAVASSQRLEFCCRGWLRRIGNGFLVKGTKVA